MALLEKLHGGDGKWSKAMADAEACRARGYTPKTDG